MPAYGQGAYGQGPYGQGSSPAPGYVTAVLADSPWGEWPVSQPVYNPFVINTGSASTKFLPGPGSVAEDALDGAGGARSTGGVAPVASNVTALPAPGTDQSMTFLVRVVAGVMSGTFSRLGGAADGWGVGVGGTTVDNTGRQLILLAEGIAWLPTGWSFPAGTGTYRVHVTRAGSSYAAYVNGAAVWSGSSATNAPAAALAIGSGVMSSPNPRVLTAGVVLDDFAYFGTALTAARVAAQQAAPSTQIDADAPLVHLAVAPVDTLQDLTANHRDLLQQSGPAPTLAAPGAPGGLPFLDFNPTDLGYLRTLAVVAQPTTVTYEAWVRLNALPPATVNVQAFGGSDFTGVTSAMQIDTAGRVQFALYNGADASIRAASPLSLGAWHHIVCSVGAAGAVIRVNKVTVASSGTTSVLSITSGAFYVRHGGPNTAETVADIDIACPAVWRTQLSNAQTDAHYAAAFPYEAAVLADAPILYAPLGETAAPALDHSPAHATVDAQGSYTYGVPGRAPGVLAGGLSSAAIVTNATLGTFNEGTIEMWVKTTTAGGATLASCRGSGGYSLTLYMGLNPVGAITPGQLVFGISGDGTWTGVRTSKVVNDGAWHHIVAVWDGTPGVLFDLTQCAIYVDGVQAALTAIPYSNPSVPITATRGYYFGGHGFESSGDVTGSMSDLAIYPTPLSKARAQAHYTAGGGTVLDPAARGPLATEVTAHAPLAYWRLNDTTDSSGNAHDGTTAGSVGLAAASLTVSEPGNGSGDFTGGRFTVPYGTWVDPTAAAFSVFALLRPRSQGSGAQIINHDAGGGGGELSWRIYLNTGRLSCVAQRADGAYITLTCATTLAVDTTYDVAVTFDGTTMRGYVNGTLDGTQAVGGTLAVRGTPVSLGGLTSGSGNFDGRMDEVALYASALTATDVSRLHTAALTPPTGGGSSGATVIAAGLTTEADAALTAATLSSQALTAGVPAEADTAPLAYTITSPPLPTDAYSAVVLADAPLLFWKLGESGNVALDYSGNHRAGILSGAYTRGAAPVVVTSDGASTDFDAGTAERGDDAGMRPPALTVELWFTLDSAPVGSDVRVIAARGMMNRYSAADSWGVYLVGSTLRYFLNGTQSTGGGITIDRSLGVVTAGTRYHLVFSIESSGSNPDPATFNNVRCYLNGMQPSGSGSTGNGDVLSTPAPGTALTVGSGSYRVDAGDPGSVRYFDGHIDEFALYPTALSGARMQAHYAAGLPPTGVIIPTTPTESDTAPPAVTRATLPVETPAESDTALPARVRTRVMAGLPTDAETALPVTVLGAVGLPAGLPAETDTAPPITVIGPPPSTVEVHVTDETDEALPVVVASGVITIETGLPEEFDEALPAAVMTVVGAARTRSGGRRREGLAAARWSPPVVPPPQRGRAPVATVAAQAFLPPVILGARPVLDPVIRHVTAHRHRILVGGRDVTYFRGIPTPEADYQLQEPLGYGPGSLTFPQIAGAYETPGVGALSWLRKGATVEVQRVDPDTGTVVATDYRGIVIAYKPGTSTYSVDLGGDLQGRAALTDKPQPIFKKRNDLGFWWWGAVKEFGRPFTPRLGPDTGITLGNSGGNDWLSYMSDLSSKGTTRGGAQWVCMPDENGTYSVSRKDLTTVHATAYNDDARLVASLSSDAAEEPNRVYATGVAPSGRRIRFGAYPLLQDGRVAPYPFDDHREFAKGTVDADTDTGDGITVMVWRLQKAGYLDLADTPGGFDDDAADAIRALKRQAGIYDTTGPSSGGSTFGTQNGRMTIEAWRALYDVTTTGYDIAGSKILPAAQDPRVEPWRRSGSGGVIGTNPAYDSSVLVVDRSINVGTDQRKSQIRSMAQHLIDVGATDNWTGSLSFPTGALVLGDHTPGDPLPPERVMQAKALRPGMNVRLPHFAGGITVHVSAVSVSGGDVTATVDTRARDAMEVWEVIDRNRQSRINPARSWLRDHRSSGMTKDAVTEFDEIGGVIDDHVMLPSHTWVVFPVVAGQEGTISRLRLRTGTDGDTVITPGPDAVQSTPPAEFVVAVFGAQIKPARLQNLIGDPLLGQKHTTWTKESTRRILDRDHVLLYVAGEHETPCGYFPRVKNFGVNADGTDTDPTNDEPQAPLTGRWEDDAGFGYRTFGDPLLWVAVYADRDTSLRPGRIMWPQLEAGS